MYRASGTGGELANLPCPGVVTRMPGDDQDVSWGAKGEDKTVRASSSLASQGETLRTLDTMAEPARPGTCFDKGSQARKFPTKLDCGNSNTVTYTTANMSQQQRRNADTKKSKGAKEKEKSWKPVCRIVPPYTP